MRSPGTLRPGHVAICVLLAGAVAIVPAGAAAADQSVSIVGGAYGGFSFTPETVADVVGATYTWTNMTSVSHTVTQDGPLALWDSGTVAGSATFSFTIDAAGVFAYHCNVHPSMHGTIKVPVAVSPDSGPTGTAFAITVATQPAASGFAYDVQKRKGHGDWKDWKPGVTTASVTFKGRKPGTYSFRARLRDTSSDATSGWSPKKKITVG